MEAFANLEVRILPLDDDGYPVELELNQARQLGRGFLDPAQLPDLRGFPSDVAGTTLFAWLTRDVRIRSAVDVARGAAERMRIRIRIDAAAPELHTLPWETLQLVQSSGEHIDLAASAATPFSRYLTTADMPPGYIVPPLRILVAIAAPDRLEQLGFAAIDFEAEWSQMVDALAGAQVELIRLPQPCTLQALEDAVRSDVHVVHIVAHGVFDPQRDMASLILADVGNHPHFVTDHEIAAMFDRLVHADVALRLVFLASCETATRSPADAFRGLAPQLVRAGLPAVIAMQEVVPVKTARVFSSVFYRRLLDHGVVDLAANEARATLMTAALPGVSIPVLFMRLVDGRLFAPEIPRARQSSRRLLVLLFAVIAFAVIIIAGVLVYPAVDAYVNPSQMQGGFKVAVADFGLLDDGTMGQSLLGSDLSKSMYDTLLRDYAEAAKRDTAIGTVTFWHDTLPRTEKNWDLGVVAGATPEERAANAAALATRANADMLIHGFLTDEESPQGLVLEFYFRSPTISGEPDAADGGHRLGQPIPSSVPIDDDANATLALQSITPVLAARTSALFWVTQAMSYEFANRPEAALAILQWAEPRLGIWTEDDGQEVFYLFLGRAALFARDFAEAIRAGEEAVRLNSGYPNAHALLGQTYMDRAQLHFAAGRELSPQEAACTDAEDFANASPTLEAAIADALRAVTSLQMAVELAPRSVWPDVEPYTRMNLGLAYRVLALAQIFDGQVTAAVSSLAQGESELMEARHAFDKDDNPKYDAWTAMGLGLNYRLQAYLEEVEAWNAAEAGDPAAQAQHVDAQATLLRKTIDAYGQCLEQRTATLAHPVFQQKVLECSCVPYHASAQEALAALESGGRIR